MAGGNRTPWPERRVGALAPGPKRGRWWLVAGLMLGCLFPAMVEAQVKGLIVGAGAERYRLAVSPLKNLGAPGDSERLSGGIADVIADDLDRSGWFKIIDRSAYIEHPQRTGIRLNRFDFRDWATIGAEGLVKGGFTVQGDQVKFEFWLYDVIQQRSILGKAYSGEIRDARRMAHKFVDEIILKLTGKRGAFDTRIAYVSTGRDRFKEIYVSHLDGTEKRKVTNNRTINLFPSWAPDGKGLVFLSYKTGKPQVLAFDLLTNRETQISTGAGLNLRGRWSPDGRFLATPLERNSNQDLYLLDRSGAIVRRLTKSPAIDISPTWSPDGGRIAFVSDRYGSPQIYVVEVATGEIERLTREGTYNQSPDWSPTGELIAFAGRSKGVMNIYTIRPDGSEQRRITANRSNDEDPSWSPDGRFIAFTSNRTGARRIYTMRRDGESQRRLTGSTADDTHPSWSPRLR
jgi:TolB protein